MAFLKRLFTWWDGATIGTSIEIWRKGRRVGSDGQGNIYYESKQGGRRFVVYNGPNDASRVPPDWHAWLHHQIAGLPEDALPPAPKFLKQSEGNRTGTPFAYRPAGAIERGGHRAAASGDYEAWSPDQG